MGCSTTIFEAGPSGTTVSSGAGAAGLGFDEMEMFFFALLADFFLAPAILELLGRTRYGRRVFQRWSGAEA